MQAFFHLSTFEGMSNHQTKSLPVGLRANTVIWSACSATLDSVSCSAGRQWSSQNNTCRMGGKHKLILKILGAYKFCKAFCVYLVLFKTRRSRSHLPLCAYMMYLFHFHFLFAYSSYVCDLAMFCAQAITFSFVLTLRCEVISSRISNSRIDSTIRRIASGFGVPVMTTGTLSQSTKEDILLPISLPCSLVSRSTGWSYPFDALHQSSRRYACVLRGVFVVALVSQFFLAMLSSMYPLFSVREIIISY